MLRHRNRAIERGSRIEICRNLAFAGRTPAKMRTCLFFLHPSSLHVCGKNGKGNDAQIVLSSSSSSSAAGIKKTTVCVGGEDVEEEDEEQHVAVMAPPSSFPPADASRWAEAPPVLPLRFSSPQIAIIYGRRDNLLMRAAFRPSVLPRWRRRRRLRRRRGCLMRGCCWRILFLLFFGWASVPQAPKKAPSNSTPQ